MKKMKSVIWGFALLIIGIIMGINALGIADIDIFFDGWWTLFIIVPSFIGLLTDDDKLGSIIFLIIGVLLLLGSQDIVKFELVGKLILPIIIVLIGLSLIFKNIFTAKIRKSIDEVNKTNNTSDECSAIFTGQDIKVDNEEFNGKSVSAIFGGITLDLRKALITKDVVIKCKSIFGGIEIFIPDNVKVQVKSNSAFGGVDNKTISDNNSEITIYIDATCVFGGVDIK